MVSRWECIVLLFVHTSAHSITLVVSCPSIFVTIVVSCTSIIVLFRSSIAMLWSSVVVFCYYLVSCTSILSLSGLLWTVSLESRVHQKQTLYIWSRDKVCIDSTLSIPYFGGLHWVCCCCSSNFFTFVNREITWGLWCTAKNSVDNEPTLYPWLKYHALLFYH